MKLRYLLTAFLGLCILGSQAQTKGVWNGSGDVVSWIYDLGSGTGSGKRFSPSREAKESISSQDNKGFLPYPSSGSARVDLAPSAGGGFQLNRNVLNLKASNGDIPNKFAVYNIQEASAVSALSFTLSFNDSHKGTVIFALGNSSSRLFTSPESYSNTNQDGLFGAIRFLVGNNYTNPEHRHHNGSAYVHKAFDKDLFNKSGKLEVEIYCNSSSAEQSYTRGSKSYFVAAKSYHIFVNDVPLTISGAADLPVTGELSTDSKVDAFLFTGSNSAENTLDISVSNIKLTALAQN